MKLYHWTCLDHGAPSIDEAGVVLPHSQPLLEVQLSWWTHIPWASRADLGLNPVVLTCDRMQVQYVADVQGAQVTTWLDFQHSLVRARPRLAPNVHALEAAKGAKPAYWWVTAEPLAVTRVPLSVSVSPRAPRRAS